MKLRLSKQQAEIFSNALKLAENRRSAARRAMLDALDKDPGAASEAVAWKVRTFAECDQHLVDLRLVAEALADDGEAKGTIQSVREHFRGLLLDWRPQRSSSPIHDAFHDVRSDVLRMALGLMDTLEALRK